MQGSNAERKIIGSLMIIEAESLQEVKDTISNDAFYKENVVSRACCVRMILVAHLYTLQWDLERMIVLPFLCATPLR